MSRSWSWQSIASNNTVKMDSIRIRFQFHRKFFPLWMELMATERFKNMLLTYNIAFIWCTHNAHILIRNISIQNTTVSPPKIPHYGRGIPGSRKRHDYTKRTYHKVSSVVVIFVIITFICSQFECPVYICHTFRIVNRSHVWDHWRWSP